MRLTLVGLALALALPISVLVSRALESVALENELRHKAVAARAFDEMERELTRFLEREEARPVGDYRYYVHGGRERSGERSPLSRPPADPFVLGYFQIDPDGSTHTPLVPREAEDGSDPRFVVSPEVAEKVEQLERIVEKAWKQAHGTPLAFDPKTDLRGGSVLPGPAAGSARPVTLRLELHVESRELRAPPPEAASATPELDQQVAGVESESAYDVLSRLNRAADERSERWAKLHEAPQAEAPARRSLPPEHERSLRRGRFAANFATTPSTRASPGPIAASRPSGVLLGALNAPVMERGGDPTSALQMPDLRSAAREGSDGAGTARTTSVVSITTAPMLGMPGEPGTYVLYRTVLVGGQGYRQGLVIDQGALGRWLDRHLLEPSGLASRARVDFPAPGTDLGKLAEGSPYAYLHRFGEPFQALHAMLSLKRLPGGGNAATIYWLSALLAVVACAGFVAVYRMVYVVFHFAERRGNFASAVSHELKTPVTAIRMYAEMLRDGLVKSDAKRDEYYATITDESERLTRLIDNVLEFSRLEKGQREAKLAAGALEPVLRESIEKLRPHAKREGFELRVEIEAGLPPVRFDRDAFVQVIFNLLDNAIKYASSSGTREVVIECLRADEGVEVRVRDFGPGVPAEQLSRIFEPFYRCGDELTRTTKGSGIGLALVKELAESMGATVRGSNAEGGGFRVSIAFPAEEPA